MILLVVETQQEGSQALLLVIPQRKTRERGLPYHGMSPATTANKSRNVRTMTKRRKKK